MGTKSASDAPPQVEAGVITTATEQRGVAIAAGLDLRYSESAFQNEKKRSGNFFMSR